MEVFIERLDNFGRGICHIDGKVCFVSNALPNEVVDIEIIRSNRKYIEGKVLSYINKSCDRLEIKCPYYSDCGGCQFLNYPIKLENEYKLNKVKGLIERIGNISSDKVVSINSSNEYYYRNKAVFHVANRKLGFYKEKSNDLVSIDYCFLLRKEINLILPKLKKIVFKSVNDISEILVRVGNSNSNLAINFNGTVNDLNELEKDVECIYVNNKLVYGTPLISRIGKYDFYVSIESFFQINALVVESLYQTIFDYVKKSNSNNVLDLYCGAGAIGIYVSSLAKNILGIDSSESNIRDANKNKKLNNVSHIKFVCSRVEDYIDKIIGKYDLIIVDPPRAGLYKKTIQYLNDIAAQNIIYVSCDPATLARDLQLLNDSYEVIEVKTFNMFPKTYHVESVCLLRLR